MSHVDITRYSKRLVQLFWEPELKNDAAGSAPIWCLGRKYEAHISEEEHVVQGDIPSRKSEPPSTSMHLTGPAPPAKRSDSRACSFEQLDRADILRASVQGSASWPKDFLDDFEARIWLSYRSNFQPIARAIDQQMLAGMGLTARIKYQMAGHGGFTSDTGWGCMIRSGQSLLANALALRRFGRDYHPEVHKTGEKALLSLFADDPRAPFSIHKFVEHGAVACGTYPGQWFGPSATAKCIQALANKCKEAELKVYVTGDGPDIYEDMLMKIAKSESGRFSPTLVLVGTRLGIDRVTPVYGDALKTSLQLPQAVGIAGGRPSSSHYFVGTQGDHFFYLDPHHTRTALPYHDSPEDYTATELESCHTRRLRRLGLEEMDPSMLIGFLFKDEADWRQWKRTVSEAPGKAIFHVAETQPPCYGSSTERKSLLDDVDTFDDEVYDSLE